MSYVYLLPFFFSIFQLIAGDISQQLALTNQPKYMSLKVISTAVADYFPIRYQDSVSKYFWPAVGIGTLGAVSAVGLYCYDKKQSTMDKINANDPNSTATPTPTKYKLLKKQSKNPTKQKLDKNQPKINNSIIPKEDEKKTIEDTIRNFNTTQTTTSSPSPLSSSFSLNDPLIIPDGSSSTKRNDLIAPNTHTPSPMPDKQCSTTSQNQTPIISSEHSSKPTNNDINKTDAYGRTSLHIAAYEGDVHTVVDLLKNGADPTLPNKSGNTPLHSALANTNRELVQTLIAEGADPNRANLDQELPLHLASKLTGPNAHEIVALLLEKTDKHLWHTPDQYNNVPIRLAAEEGTVESLEVFLKNGFDPNNTAYGFNGYPLLFYAAVPLSISQSERYDSRKTELLLAHGADPKIDIDGASILHHLLSAQWNSSPINNIIKTIELLLKSGIDINQQFPESNLLYPEETPLHRAIRQDSLELIEFLLTYKPNPFILNSKGQTPLALLKEISQIAHLPEEVKETVYKPMIKMLEEYTMSYMAKLEDRLDIKKIEENEFLPVSLEMPTISSESSNSSTQNQTPIISSEHSVIPTTADINETDTYGRTSLHIASHEGNIDTVLDLLEKGADPNVPDNNGNTSLHTAAEHGNLSLVQRLIEAGANPNQTNKWRKQLPLHLAAKLKTENAHKLVALLLEKTDEKLWNTPEYRHRSPYEEALEWGTCESLKLFLNKGCDPNAKKGLPLKYTTSPNRFSTNPLTNTSDICLDPQKVALLLELGANPNIYEVNIMFTDSPKNLLEDILKNWDPDYADKIIRTIELLLKHGFQIDQECSNGNTVLHLTVEKANLELLELLLKYNPNPFILNRRRQTPLALLKEIIQASHIREEDKQTVYNPMIERLEKYAMDYKAKLKKRSDSKIIKSTELPPVSSTIDYITQLTDFGPTQLHIAASTGNTDAVLDLLKNGVDPNVADEKGNTALHFAAKTDHIELIKLLLEYRPNPNLVNCDNKTPLDILKKRFKKKYDIWDDDDKFYERFEYKHMISLLKGYVTLYNNNLIHENPMTDATKNKILEKLDADLSSSTPLGPRAFIEAPPFTKRIRLIAKWGSVELLALCLSKYKDAISQSNTDTRHPLLHLAAKGNNTQNLLLLLQNGADPNFTDKGGNTPLHYAASNGNLHAIRALIEWGADCNMLNSFDELPLHLAAQANKEQAANIVSVLLKHTDTDSLDAVDEQGCTPIEYAAAQGTVETFKLLLEHGYNPNKPREYSLFEFIVSHLPYFPLIVINEKLKLLQTYNNNINQQHYGILRAIERVAIHDTSATNDTLDVVHCLLNFKPNPRLIYRNGKTLPEHLIAKGKRYFEKNKDISTLFPTIINLLEDYTKTYPEPSGEE
jgi:ankyrin repeat protein